MDLLISAGFSRPSIVPRTGDGDANAISVSGPEKPDNTTVDVAG
jgi:hypothetical protein